MKAVAAALGLVWAALNVALGLLMVANAFVAKTAQHEGLPAQAALLLGGLAIAMFAVLLGWQCYRLVTRSATQDALA
jgi:ABC-type polysaccharide/polyol phosphate export permease